MIIKYKKLNPDAKAPVKKISVDAGFDLTAVWKDVTSKYTAYGTGIAVEIPQGYVGLIFSRSSVTKKDMMLKNAVGVIDASYRGEIMCRYYNLEGNDVYEVGERVCQIVFLELPYFEMEESKVLSETERGTAGYGSSGK